MMCPISIWIVYNLVYFLPVTIMEMHLLLPFGFAGITT